MTDPIDRPDFNPQRGREANPERMAVLKDAGEQWKRAKDAAEEARLIVKAQVEEAYETGHSLRQLSEVLDVPLATVQRMLNRPC